LKQDSIVEEKKLSKKSPNDMDTLENAWRECKKLSDEIKNGKNESVVRDAELVNKFRSKSQDRANLGRSLELTSTDMALIDKQFEILYLPKTAEDLLTDLTVNADYLELDVFMQAFGGDVNLEAVSSIVARDGAIPSQLLYLDDDFSGQSPFGLKSELTYGITINHERNLIAVVFRGSTALNDWITNVQFDATDFELPSPTAKTHTNHGKVHEGFYAYLYHDTKPGKDGRTISKSEEIMGKLQGLFITYPKYTLCVTGHSLGGSLSTLFAFRAAKDAGIPNKPVINVSFASPFVGDQKFQHQFQDLERNGLIRHLRISNEDDVVPLIPFATIDLVPMLYKHVGMNVRLYNKKPWHPFTNKISYPKVGGNLFDELGRAINNNILLGLTFQVIENHLCPEYRERLDNAKEDLKKLNLESLYHDKHYVGSLFTNDA
jgi:hypothetical protein